MEFITFYHFTKFLIAGAGNVYEEAIVNGDFDKMKKYYTEADYIRVSFPLTTAKDTAFHMAVYSKTKQPLQYLLEIAEYDALTKTAYKKTNAYGSTALHVAAKVGNFEAVKLLVQKDRSLLEMTDKQGETPLYKAAARGHTRVAVYLASQPGQSEIHRRNEHGVPILLKLNDIHRRNKNDVPILHVTIRGGNYGTALKLVELDESLALDRDPPNDKGMSSLQLLADFPSAFKSGNPMGLWQNILYFVLPIFKYTYNVKRVHSEATGIETPKDSTSRDIETGDLHGEQEYHEGDAHVELEYHEGDVPGNNEHHQASVLGDDEDYKVDIHGDDEDYEVSKASNGWDAFWRFLFRVRPNMRSLWKEKRKHKFALELAKILIKKDYSWERHQTREEDPTTFLRVTGETDKKTSEIDKVTEPENHKRDEIEGSDSKTDNFENPLFIATRNGIVEIVEEILHVSPLAVELYSDKQQNILHIAILHRQKKIFKMVKKKSTPFSRLIEGIDKNGFSILHCAADMEHYTGTSCPGPAYQLQDELKWFHRVEKKMPPHLAMHHKAEIHMTPHSDMQPPEVKELTAKMFFDQQHQKTLNDAQKWIKQTSQSCSTVAVLIATVVFAAAYTVPGGFNDAGLPNFQNSPSFLFFTIMDVVSLACSLTSVVMFLSILLSPFEMEDFLYSLPLKLTAGFILLFLSVATTTLAFASTV